MKERFKERYASRSSKCYHFILLFKKWRGKRITGNSWKDCCLAGWEYWTCRLGCTRILIVGYSPWPARNENIVSSRQRPVFFLTGQLGNNGRSSHQQRSFLDQREPLSKPVSITFSTRGSGRPRAWPFFLFSKHLCSQRPGPNWLTFSINQSIKPIYYFNVQWHAYRINVLLCIFIIIFLPRQLATRCVNSWYLRTYVRDVLHCMYPSNSTHLIEQSIVRILGTSTYSNSASCIIRFHQCIPPFPNVPARCDYSFYFGRKNPLPLHARDSCISVLSSHASHPFE